MPKTLPRCHRLTVRYLLSQVGTGIYLSLPRRCLDATVKVPTQVGRYLRLGVSIIPCQDFYSSCLRSNHTPSGVPVQYTATVHPTVRWTNYTATTSSWHDEQISSKLHCLAALPSHTDIHCLQQSIYFCHQMDATAPICHRKYCFGNRRDGNQKRDGSVPPVQSQICLNKVKKCLRTRLVYATKDCEAVLSRLVSDFSCFYMGGKTQPAARVLPAQA